MFTPSLKIIKENYPDAVIDALVMFRGAEQFYSKIPEISTVHYHDFIHSSILSSLFYVLKLRGKYDLSFNVYPSNRREYNIINFLIGAKKRAGVDYLRKNFANLGFLNNVRITEDDNLHNVEENVRLAESAMNITCSEIPPLSFPIEEVEEKYAAEYLDNNKINRKDFVVGIHAGCSVLKNHINRRWAPERFAEVSVHLIAKYNAKILIFGGPDEEMLKDSIVKFIGNESARNVKTGNILQTASIMKRCNLFLTNDSGLMHIAAALDLNIIALLGPTNKNYIRPWKARHKIASIHLDCAPCFYYSPKPLTCYRDDIKFKCIKELNADMVINSAEDMIKENNLVTTWT
jgi:heptosyltransferase-2